MNMHREPRAHGDEILTAAVATADLASGVVDGSVCVRVFDAVSDRLFISIPLSSSEAARDFALFERRDGY